MTKSGIFTINGKHNFKRKVEQKQRKNERDNSNQHEDVSYWNLFYIPVILFGCAVVSFPQTMIPRHNSIEDSSFWFEINIVFAFAIFTLTTVYVLECYVFTDERSLISVSVFSKLFVWNTIGWLVPYCLSYYIWSHYLGYNHPMPLVGMIWLFNGWVWSIAGLWLHLPSKLLSDQGFRNKLKWYIVYNMWFLVITIQNEFVLAFAFEKFPAEFQWIIAFVLPLARLLNKQVITKIIFRMVGSQNAKANALGSFTLSVQYALFIAIRLVGAEKTTAYCLMVIDFLLQSKMTYQIVREHRKVTKICDKNVTTMTNKNGLLKKLVITESVEGLVPLAYAIGFGMSYYGPNGNLIGNVKNGYWTYKPVDDPSRLFKLLFFFFFIDTLCVILNTILLKKYCKINLIKEFCKILKSCWFFMAVKLSVQVSTYFLSNDINLGRDSTFHFNWTIEEGRLGLIYDSMNEYNISNVN